MIEFFVGLAILCGYFITCATVALVFRKLTNIPNEIFRKILHFILLGSSFVFVFAYDTWWISALTCLLIIVIAYPILYFFERFKTYSNTMSERKKGEVRSSLIIVFIMFAIIISICFGYFNDKVLSLVAILAWGIGDAFAALVGTKHGKHKIYKKKSLEGTVAMFLSSITIVLLVLMIHSIIPWYGILFTSFVVSMIVSIVELYTPNGLDTFTCPLAALCVMIPLLYLFGGLA